MDENRYVLLLSGPLTISADGEQTRIELSETQLRSLAYHAGQVVEAIKPKVK